MNDTNQQDNLLRNVDYVAGLGKRFIENLGNLYGKVIYFTGQLPFDLDDLIGLLPPDIEGRNLETENPPSYANPKTAYIVVGREGFDENEILRYINEMQPSVAFLPQEGFIDLLFGHSWWEQPSRWSVDSNPLHILNLYEQHHSGLQYVKQQADLYGFPWPGTDAKESLVGGGINEGWNKESDLKRDYGYSIRNQRNKLLTDTQRWMALRKAMSDGATVQIIAEHIAMLIKNARRQRGGVDFYKWAIPRWEEDLAKLEDKYGNGESWWPN